MKAKTDLELAYDRLKVIHDFEYELEARIRVAAQPVFDKNSNVELSAENIQSRIKELATEIAKDTSFQDFVLIGILDGGLPFAEALRRELKALNVRFQYATIQAKSYIGTVSGDLSIQSDSKVPVAGKKILFVDDVWDTGNTLDKIAKKALSQYAGEIRNAVLVNKEPAKERPYKKYTTYVGFTVPEDAFIIGFGLDYEGMLRNEESITAVDKKTLPNALEQELLDSKKDIIKEIDRLSTISVETIIPEPITLVDTILPVETITSVETIVGPTDSSTITSPDRFFPSESRISPRPQYVQETSAQHGFI